MSCSINSVPQPLLARTPFDDRDFADVVVRTSDNVEFYLIKALLRIASTVFKDMFSVPQPTDAISSPGPVMVPISEESQTFDSLLRFIYPVDDPFIATIDDAEKVLEVATKYGIAQAIKHMSAIIGTQFLASHRLDIFAIACKYNMEELAQLAAKAWRAAPSYPAYRQPDFTYTLEGATFVPRMTQISTGAYYRLLCYLRNPSSMTVRFTDGGDPAQARTSLPNQRDNNLQSTDQPQPVAYDFTGADSTLISTDHVRFPVHSGVLRLASAEKLLEGIPQLNGDILIDMDGLALSKLLRMCYPLSDHTMDDYSSWIAIYSAADRLRLERVLSVVRGRFNDLLSHVNSADLMAMYLVASEQGWAAEAHHAAVAIVRQELEHTYAVKMDETRISALHYYRLLKFCHGFRQAMIPLLQQPGPTDTSYYRPTNLLNVRLDFTSIPLPVMERMMHQQRASCSYTPNTSVWLEERDEFEKGVKEVEKKIQLDVGPWA